MEYLTNLPVAWANYLSMAGFAALGLLVWMIPRAQIFKGTSNHAGWRDIRWWATALILLQLCIYAIFT